MKIDGKHAVTWVARIVTGCVFIFSGVVKGIDPWGTLYKFDDYLAAMSIEIWPNLVLVSAFGLSAVEFLIGIFLLTGCFRRSAAILAAVFMAVMLPLTLWIAIDNPVADCGCFGDAVVLSNWATFWKNVALGIAVGWLVAYNRRCSCLITPALQWIAIVVSVVYILLIELFGYNVQPLVDFRPYPVGEKLVDIDLDDASEPHYIFIYEKDGVRNEFHEDDVLPDENDGWTFIDRIEIENGDSAEKADPENDKNLRIWSRDGEEDETQYAIVDNGKELIITMPDLKLVSPATTWKLNSLYEWSVKNNVDMIAVVSGSDEEISDWEDLSMASYPIFTADDTQIKSVVRGNPGVVYLIDGRVIWKSTLVSIDIEDFLSPETTTDARNFSIEDHGILRNLSYVYASVMIALMAMSYVPYLKRFFPKSVKQRDESQKKSDSAEEI